MCVCVCVCVRYLSMYSIYLCEYTHAPGYFFYYHPIFSSAEDNTERKVMNYRIVLNREL